MSSSKEPLYGVFLCYLLLSYIDNMLPKMLCFVLLLCIPYYLLMCFSEHILMIPPSKANTWLQKHSLQRLMQVVECCFISFLQIITLIVHFVAALSVGCSAANNFFCFAKKIVACQLSFLSCLQIDFIGTEAAPRKKGAAGGMNSWCFTRVAFYVESFKRWALPSYFCVERQALSTRCCLVKKDCRIIIWQKC